MFHISDNQDSAKQNFKQYFPYDNEYFTDTRVRMDGAQNVTGQSKIAPYRNVLAIFVFV